MCGIAGVLNLQDGPPPTEMAMRRMLAMIRHRGPDEFGILIANRIALGSARLSIVDLHSGQQPIGNEEETLWIVFNGEIFNHVELRRELELRGHRFRTQSDTEVVLHCYEEYGTACLGQLNGQFAIAIWDIRKEQLFLARDRLGVRPLLYSVTDGVLVFGSEVKALLAEGRLTARIDPVVLDQVFTFWTALSPCTIFEGVREIPPGHYMEVVEGDIRIRPYWRISFPEPPGAGGDSNHGIPQEEWVSRFGDLLHDAACIRLRADVPVGAYLSGGLDSSTIATLARAHVGDRLHTFSIAFDDAQFDESPHQLAMARHLGTDHRVQRVSHADIGRVFPDVIWHVETPLMRTSPAPMFLLSKLVRDQQFKVVLTGEGADEFLGGYDIFKEAKVRRFWASQPDSPWRPLLLKRLYPDIAGLGGSNTAYLAAFFGEALTDVDDPLYSHLVRWRNNRRTCRFFSDQVKARATGSLKEAIAQVEVPDHFARWHPLQRAQHLEATIFLPQYLLSSQGDRAAMAHSVEGRFPFLDHRLVELCNALPVGLKLRRLSEKFILRQFAGRFLPPEILQRPKRPYRAPIQRCFFGHEPQAYAEELLSPECVRQAGWFRPEPVSAMVAKLRQSKPLGETDEMALAGILSTQLVQHQFVDHLETEPPLGERDRVKIVRCGHGRGSAPD